MVIRDRLPGVCRWRPPGPDVIAPVAQTGACTSEGCRRIHGHPAPHPRQPAESLPPGVLPVKPTARPRAGTRAFARAALRLPDARFSRQGQLRPRPLPRTAGRFLYVTCRHIMETGETWLARASRACAEMASGVLKAEQMSAPRSRAASCSRASTERAVAASTHARSASAAGPMRRGSSPNWRCGSPGVRSRTEPAAQRHACASGRITVKRLPCPFSLSIRSLPRWRLMMCLTMASPSPVPPCSRERWVSTR